MDQTFETPKVGRLVRQAALPELRPDGYPVAVDHVFAVWTGDDAAPTYPIRVTVETAVAEGSGKPVLVALAAEARSRLETIFVVSQDLGIWPSARDDRY